MGCDIHPYVEVFDKSKWTLVKPINACDYDKYQLDIYRDYLFFGVLAGVRRAHIPPIKCPVGLPSDISNKLQKIWDRGEVDYHTPSYYTLTELLEVKEKTIKTSGFVDIENYKLIKLKGFPEDWRFHHKPFKSILGEILITSEQADRLLNLSAFLDEKKYVIEATWNQPYKFINEDFWTSTIEKMQELNENTDHVRMVFWFDN